jgi:universal stress protein E
MTIPFAGYRRILAATDFSPSAEAALRQAVWLARTSGASITLAHCLPNLRRVVHSASTKAKLDLLYGEGDQFEREVRRKSDERMRRIIADLGAVDLDVAFETLLGEPFVELTHAVQAEGYDLVLAGTRGRAAWEQFFIGSTANRLIRKCPASVWIVKPEHVGVPRAILAPTDFSEVSLQSAAHGLWIARQAAAKFHLLHVIDSSDVPDDLISHVPEGSSLREEINAEAAARLEEFLARLGTGRSQIEVHLSWGTPWKEIQRLSAHLAVDLIAIGTVGRSGIQGLLLGNTAEKVLATCDASILAIKPADFVSPIPPASWPLHPGN